jgi:hypothetical protein
VIEPSSTGAPVLLRARIEDLTKDMSKRYWGKFAVTDQGDHIEYTDSKQVKRWRLADQPGEEPVLDTVLIVRYPNVLGGKGADDVVFLDPAGNLLGRFNPRGAVPLSMMSLVMPDDVYDGLRARGVTVRSEKFASTEAFYQAHQDPNANPAASHLARHLFAYIALLVVLIVVVVVGAMAINGSFSS